MPERELKGGSWMKIIKHILLFLVFRLRLDTGFRGSAALSENFRQSRERRYPGRAWIPEVKGIAG
jgi:hypothetical protein